MGEITYLWEEEVNCPKVSPLTLIGITKGPRNKGKAVIEEEEEILRIEQAPREEVNMEAQKINEVPTVPLYTSAMEEVPSHELPYWHLFTGTRSFSPTWGRPQEARNIHPPRYTSPGDTRNFPEQAESLRQGQGNGEMMEMLQLMRKEMHERDRQLKLQLQLRDVYLDQELRKRYRY